MRLRKFISKYCWSIGYSITIIFVTFGWQGLELLFYGEIQPRIVDNIIGLILFLSILINFVFIKAIYVPKVDRDKYIVLSKEDYSDIQKKWYEEFYCILKTLENNLKILDIIISNTIKNEDGEETSTIKFDSVKSFAQNMKNLNDINIKYIEKQLGKNDNKDI